MHLNVQNLFHEHAGEVFKLRDQSFYIYPPCSVGLSVCRYVEKFQKFYKSRYCEILHFFKCRELKWKTKWRDMRRGRRRRRRRRRRGRSSHIPGTLHCSSSTCLYVVLLKKRVYWMLAFCMLQSWMHHLH